MFIIGNLITAVARILEIVVTLYYWLLIIRVILSWIPSSPRNELIVLLHNLTDPVLDFFRRYIPALRRTGASTGIDFTPLVAILVLYFVEIFLIGSLLDLGHSLAQ